MTVAVEPGLPADRAGRTSTRISGPTAVVGATVVFNLWCLRAERLAATPTNDNTMHQQMVRWAGRQIAHGRVPLDGWFPDLSLGSAHFHHYQSIEHVITAYAGRLFGMDTAFHWSLYLILATWPVAIFVSARWFGLDRWAAASAAALSPLLVSVPGYGFEWGSFTWHGYGMWSEAWAMWVLPLALAAAWRALSGRGSYAVAAALVALTLALHFLTGYFAVGSVGLFALLHPPDVLRRAGRAALVLGGSVLIAAWVIVPVLADDAYINRSTYFPNTYFTDSFGPRRVFGWLVSGALFDGHRIPIITALVAAGLIVCLARARADLTARAPLAVTALGLVLYSGKGLLGPLLDIMPSGHDLYLHRYLLGVHLGGLLLAGTGLAWIGREAGRRVPELRARHGDGVVLTAGIVVAVALLFPAWHERADYAATGARLVADQRVADRTDGADAGALIDRAKTLGGGRIYAGLQSNWGHDYQVGSAPVYALVSAHDADQVGLTLRLASLSTDIETVFDERNPADYDLLDVRYLLLPADRPPPVPATLLEQRGRHTLWQVPTTGYLGVVDTTTPVAADNANLLARMQGFLRRVGTPGLAFPTVAFAGHPAAAPTLADGATISGSPGTVGNQLADGDDGVYGGHVTLTRTAVVVLKSSYDPRWSVVVDGVPTPAAMIAPSFVGVTVPAGEHDVLFRYRPYPHYPLLFLVGALALVGLVVFGRSGIERAEVDDDFAGDVPPLAGHAAQREAGEEPEGRRGRADDDEALGQGGERGAVGEGRPVRHPDDEQESIDQESEDAARERTGHEQVEESAGADEAEPTVHAQRHELRPLREQQAGEEGLESEHERDARKEHRLPAQRPEIDPGRVDQAEHRQGEAGSEERGAGPDQDEMGREQHDELQVTPTVGEGAELRPSDPLGIPGDDLSGPQPGA